MAILTDVEIASLQANLSTIQGLADDKVPIVIALLQMLNQTDPVGWTFDKCDAFIGKLASDTTTGVLNARQLDELMIIMSQVSNAQVVPDTVLRVSRYRKAFLYLLASGVGIATLQAMFPGALSFILDQAYSIFVYLKTQGMAEVTIAAEVARNPSPFTAGPFAAAFASAFASAVSSGVTAAFYACAAAAAAVGSAVVSHTPSILGFGAQFLGFTLAVAAAKNVVGRVASAADVVYDAVTGEYDEAIATWINEGGMGRTQAAINAAAAAVAATAFNAVNYTKGQIIDAINNMSEINRDVAVAAPGWVPAVGVGPTIWDMINHALDERVKQAAIDYNTNLGMLIGDLSQIEFTDDDASNPDIIALASKYGIGWGDPGFRALIAIWKLSIPREQILKKSLSLPMPIPVDTYRPEQKAAERSASLPPDWKDTPYGEGQHTRHETKPILQLGPSRDFVFDPRNLSEPEHIINPLLKKTLMSLRYSNVLFPRTSVFSGQTIQNVVSRYPDEIQRKIRKQIRLMKTRPTHGRTTGETEKNATINKLNTMKLIEKIIRPQENSHYSELLDNPNFVVEEIETVYPSIEDDDDPMGEDDDDEMEEGGSRRRRRHRKSRRYKKRKSTLKRRGIKRRRTRKGKKRRHTKKR